MHLLYHYRNALPEVHLRSADESHYYSYGGVAGGILKNARGASGTGTVEDYYAPAAADRAGLSPGVEVELYDSGSGGVGGDYPGLSGGGAAVPSQIRFDVSCFPHL